MKKKDEPFSASKIVWKLEPGHAKPNQDAEKCEYFAKSNTNRENAEVEEVDESKLTHAFKLGYLPWNKDDKNDARSKPNGRDIHWFWINTLDGKELTDDEHFVARPCPPYCADGL